MTSIFSPSEQAWLERRAQKIAAETEEPLPIARSQAMAELIRLKARPKADVISFDSKIIRSDKK